MHLNPSFLVALLPLASGFVHPGLLVTDSDITRAQQKIKANADPWTASWNVLTRLRFSDASYTPSPASTVYRSDWDGNTANAEDLWHDVAAAFNLALRWKISSNTTFADTASNILHAWATKLTALGGGDDKYLTAGLQGYQLANAAELLRDYEPFASKVLPSVIDMANTIFIPMHYKWLRHEEPSQHNVLHFFANWELCNIASAMAMGVLTDNQTVWDFAVEYFKEGDGTGAINNAITDIVEEPGTGVLLGQGQEAGRDQGHSALDVQLLAVVGQQAWNQGEDLFALNDSRILKGTEHWARYNLGHDVPFVPYTNGIVSFTEISSASRGAMRPTWELLYNHYVVIKGMDAPWTTKFLNESLNYYDGAEGGAGSWGEGSGHYDGLGWGSLLHHLDVAAQGSGANTLIASPSSGKATSTPLPESTPGSSSAVSSGAKSTSASMSATSSTPAPQSSPATSSPGTSTPAASADPQSTPRPTKAGQKPSQGHRHHRHGHKHGGCRAHSLV